MRIVSVNIGELTPIVYQGRHLQTGIFKYPAPGPVELLDEQLQNDHIANPKVHGGPHKAVYAYPIEHYPFWSQQYPLLPFDCGMFGENITTEGILESQVYVGDRLIIGAVELEISEPRQPCFKLGVKFQDSQIIKSFLRSGWTGFYLRIIKKGTLKNGDRVKLAPGPQKVSIPELNNFLQGKEMPVSWYDDALASSALSEKWKDRIARSLTGK